MLASLLVLGVAGGACKKKERKAVRLETTGPAESVPAADKKAADKAESSRVERRNWLGRVLAFSTCFWIVRDIDRANRYFDDVLQRRKRIGMAQQMKPRHFVVDCHGQAKALSPEEGHSLRELLEIAEQLKPLSERVQSYISERDYIEDKFVQLEKLHEQWAALIAKTRIPVAAMRLQALDQREALRKALEPDLAADNLTARTILLVLLTLEAEEILARRSSTLATELEGIIARFSEVREALRDGPVRPGELVFDELSSIIGALKQVRRDLDDTDGKASFLARDQARTNFYRRALHLFRVVRNTLEQ